MRSDARAAPEDRLSAKRSGGSRHQRMLQVMFSLTLALVAICTRPSEAPSGTLPAQTPVETAGRVYDDNGVLMLEIEGVGSVYNPAFIALDALQFAGRDMYHGARANNEQPDGGRATAAVRWLVENVRERPGSLFVWEYPFDTTYNDATLEAPWISAFGQAVGIEALIVSAEEDGNSEHLALAEKAARVFFVPIEDGGVLFRRGDDIWFEEFPDSAENPTHILNGHMRALIAIKMLEEATGDEAYGEWFDRGCATLCRWLPRFDAGYAFRYDLQPRGADLLFRLANPYGFEGPPVALDSLALVDPVTGVRSSIDAGAEDDFEGECRLAGNAWGRRGVLDGRSVRRIRSFVGAAGEDIEDNGPAPYFHLSLPTGAGDNLREDWWELEVTYRDEIAANLTVQMRSIDPDGGFVDLRDGDLLLTGSGRWRTWKIPLKPSDLGFPVGGVYPKVHAAYLEFLSRYRTELKPWARTARAYEALSREADIFLAEAVELSPLVLPKQTPLLPVYSLDADGVVMQHYPTAGTKFRSDGGYDPSGDDGLPVYHFFATACQAMEGPELGGGAFSTIDREDIKREPALRWLLDPANFTVEKDAAVYHYGFDNCYNDIYTKAPWQSAFGQAYVVKALCYAAKNAQSRGDSALEHLQKVINAFNLPIEKGGVSTLAKDGGLFAEEVPEKTHVLNAHLVSAVSIGESLELLDTAENRALYDDLVATLRNRLHTFDNGYWSRYDQNPQKELLCQIDWLRGELSPEIDEIWVVDPVSNKATKIDVGARHERDAYPAVSGVDWGGQETVDGRSVRGFKNGYSLRDDPLPGGARHNVFFRAAVAEREHEDFFDVAPVRIVIRYRDVAAGEFVLKVQANNEGNRLELTPLRRGIWRCTGDGKWKQAEFTLRPNDTGWYMGADYQRYHATQLSALAGQTGDWFFKQYAEKWSHYYEAYQSGEQIISPGVLADFALSARGETSAPTYEGHSLENALDGDPDDDYVAGESGPLPQAFEIHLDRPVVPRWVELVWESEENHATRYTLESVDAAGLALPLADIKNASGMHHLIAVKGVKPLGTLRVTVCESAGQERLLLRQVKIIAPVEPGLPCLPDADLVDVAPFARVVHSSDMCPGYGVENALDGDPDDDYTAALAEGGPQSVTLEWPWPVSIEAADLVWESDENHAADYVLYVTAEGGRKAFAAREGAEGKVQRIVPSMPLETRRLTLAANRFAGQDRFLLRQLKVYVRSESALIASTDEANPLSLYALDIPAALIAVRNEALGGKEGLSAHEKILRFMDYLCAFRIEEPSKQDLVAPIDEQRGSCGSFANILIALCAVEGIDGRPVSLLNFPPNDGHAVAEFRIRGKWRLYDPTFGVYYARVSAEGREDVLSFEELRAGGATQEGVVLRRSPGARTEDSVTAAQKEYFSARAYVEAEPAGPTGPGFPMVFPLKLDLRLKASMDDTDFNAQNQGAWILGSASVNVSQRFTLTGLSKAKRYALTVSYSGAGGRLEGRTEFEARAEGAPGTTVESGGSYLYRLSGENEPWRVVFQAWSGEAALLLTHDYRQPFYLYAKKYELEEVE